MQPVALHHRGLCAVPEHPPSPDYVPGPEHPSSPAEVPYVPEPKYPEYLVPSDDEAPWEDQPLPADASPIALSPGYVADSDLEEDPEEDPEEDHADYPADGGDDDDEPSDDDDDDTNDEDEEPFEDEDDDEEEEHLAPADFVIAPTVDYVPSPEETEPGGCRELLALPPPPPSPLISLSPPSAEERLARCLAAPALLSSPLLIALYPYGSPNHVCAPPGFRAAIGRLRASSSSTHHPLHPLLLLPPLPSSLHLPPHVPTSLPLPSSPLPLLPALLFIPPPVDYRDDTPEGELPPRKRLCLTALTSMYEVGESSIAPPRPTGGHGIDYGFIGTLDAKTRRQRAEEFGYGIRDVLVDLTEAVEEGQLSVALGQIQALQARGQTHVDDREGAASTAVGLVFSFLVSDNHNNMLLRRSSATARAVATAAARAAVAAATPMIAAVEQLIEARVSTALANHETLRNSTNGQGDGSYNYDTGIRGTVRTPRECTYKDFLNFKPFSFKGTEGVVVLSQWFKKIESVFHISNCAVENQVKFATCTFLRNALTWWNSHMKTVTQDVAYAMD
ncbi:hypothetical protein Tco_0344294 [Tanacetum coccineum]